MIEGESIMTKKGTILITIITTLSLLCTGCLSFDDWEETDPASSQEAASTQATSSGGWISGDSNISTTETLSADDASTEYQPYEYPVSENPAPDFTAQLVDGSAFTLSEHRGTVVLVNFWATWCGPCCAEMPAFQWLDDEYGDNVYILAINCMEDTSTVQRFLSENGYTFPVACDTDGSISSLYPTDGIPYTVVIGKDGGVYDSFVGAYDATSQYEEYKAAIDAALAETPNE